MTTSLTAISPIDGRYQSKTANLGDIFSEYGLIKYRTHVEVQWLLALTQEQALSEVRTLSDSARQQLLDIANHFNEFAGGTSGNATPDYSQFPSSELQVAFVSQYLTTMHQSPPTQPQIDALLKEIKGFVLANHLVWGLWGVNQSATEGCEEFDYLQYGKCRIERYFEDKKAWDTN